MPKLITLTKRAEFLRLKKGRSYRCELFILQGMPRTVDMDIDHTHPRIGFIITKKIGNAVVRNRIRRRLRAAIQLILKHNPEHLRPEWDYVIIPHLNTLSADFDAISTHVTSGFKRVG